MDVSIVIVSYNTCRLLDECIQSIKIETNISYEIIVVDNASNDDSCKMLRDKHPTVQLIENAENVGFAKANNIGFSNARGRYYLMLNPDTLILNGALDILFEYMENNSDVGICGPRNLDRDGNLQYSCDHFPNILTTLCSYLNMERLFPNVGFFKRSQMKYWDYAEIRDVDKIMGCCLMVRSDLFIQIGGLDESYFMYFEETDLCLKAKRLCYRVKFLPTCSIIHYGGECSKNEAELFYIDNKIFQLYYRSKYIFLKKNCGIIPMLFARALDFTYGIVLILYNRLTREGKKRETGLLKGHLYCAASLKDLLVNKDAK